MSAFEQDVDDAYRALGKYVFRFSRLVFMLRSRLSQVIAAGDPARSLLGDYLLGEVTAQPIANSFFGIMMTETGLDEDEQKVARRLRDQVNDTITLRNAVAHGDWWIGWGFAGATTPDPPTLDRYRPSRKAGLKEVRELSVADLDAMSEKMAALQNLVDEFAELCVGTRRTMDGQRVGDYLIIENGEVVREGPRVGISTFRSS